MPKNPVRIDGLPKVLGEKVYARDFRASDLPGWPSTTQHALLLRAGVADRTVSLDISAIKRLNKPPKVIITAADLASKSIRPTVERQNVARTFGTSWFVVDGTTPDHVAQPVALLVFSDPDALREAQEWFSSGNSVLRLGEPKAIPEQDVRLLLDPLIAVRQRDADKVFANSAVHYVRVAGSADDEFSHVKDGPHNPTAVGPNIGYDARQTNLRALDARASIDKAIAEAGWTVLDRNFSTQTTDPMFMEPEAGLAWLDRTNNMLRLVIGTQSPNDDRDDTLNILNKGDCPFKNIQVQLITCYPGGGFGGRDKSSFPMYLALAALFADGPVRLAFDRYEQFLCGIKRHASAIQARLAIDNDGTLQALQSSIVMDGGGELNLTNAVVGLSALHAAGPYRIPRTAISARGIHTTNAPAGSMRGFGIPQAALAIECLVDEVAQLKEIDPIEYRLRHVLKQGDRDVTGMVLDHHLANVKLCEMAKNEPLWINRNTEKANRDQKGLISYGVGFACCMEAYGASSDATYCEVSLRADGTIAVRSSGVDMGQGSATSIAMGTAETLGRPATDIVMGEVDAFQIFELEVGKPEENPTQTNLTKKLVNSSSASVTAFHHLHAVDEACKVIFDHGIIPAAQSIWGSLPASMTWNNGLLVADGYTPLTLQVLAETAHASAYVVGAMIHTYFQHEFARAHFEVHGKNVERMIDALAVTYGGSHTSEILHRTNSIYPSAAGKNFRRTLYASAGHLVAVQVHLPTGRIKVVDAVTILDAGDVHHEGLLGGQVEGGFAMGLGYALLEELPPAPWGVDGTWNLHRYQVPRAKHIPLERMQLRLVPLEGDSILANGPPLRKKGVAEATMSTVAPAVVNAVAHAIGIRINSLPVTSTKIREALQFQ